MLRTKSHAIDAHGYLTNALTDVVTAGKHLENHGSQPELVMNKQKLKANNFFDSTP